MDFNINKVCRICMQEGSLTSIFNTELQMMPSDMIMLCTKIKVLKGDGLPPVICNNCVYRLGIAYHFKQQCESSDARFRHYLGFPMIHDSLRDACTMTDDFKIKVEIKTEEVTPIKKIKRRGPKPSRYKRKAPEECKKRGPKIAPKIPQTCFECNKTFKCAAQLQMHIRTHTGERPYACTYCPRRFAQKHNLSIHVRTHTGEKPFQCEICSKLFSALGNFQAHQKIHKGVRDHFCQVCNKGFISAGDLTRHMVTHTGIKSHHCDVCGKSFSRGRDMANHRKKVHLADRSNPQTLPAQPVVSTLGMDMVSETLTQTHPGMTNHMHKCPAPDCLKLLPSSAALTVHFRSHAPPPVQVPTVPTHSMPLPIGIGISHPSSLGMMHLQRSHPY